MDPLEEIVRAQPGLSIALGILGLIVGSFLNVVIQNLWHLEAFKSTLKRIVRWNDKRREEQKNELKIGTNRK